MPVSHDQNSHQWQSRVSVCITWYDTFFFINFSDRNLRSNAYSSLSTPKVLRFQPIPPFIFPLQSLKEDIS